jgi:hypothetical protein
VNQKVLFIALSLIFIGVGFTLLAQQARIDDLQDQITNIQLIPGPQGERGPAGFNGSRGPPGIPGSGGSEICSDCKCPSGQYVTGFDANGGLICTGSLSSAKQVTPSATVDTSSDSFIISYETTPSATQVVTCDTLVSSGDIYYCSVECPSGVVQTSTIWINGQPDTFLSADALDSPNTLTCYSEGPATCGATCA